MASFEQNQQDAFNQRNDTDSLKRALAEADQLTASIGAAELAAEEELAAEKLKNLAEQTKAKLKQLEQFIALEEAGIRELAELRLTLSEKQFEARKKALQKERKLIEEIAGKPPKNQQNRQKTSSTQSSTTHNYTSEASGMKKADLGRFKFEDIVAGLDGLREQLSPSALTALNKVTADKNKTAPTSIEFAGELIENFEAAEAAIRKIQEFNADRDLNERLVQLSAEQKLRAEHEKATFTNITAKITAAAKAEDLKNNEGKYFQEAYWAQQQAYTNEQNKLVDERIKTEAALAYARANRDELIAQEEQKLKNAHEESAFKAMQEHIVLTAKANDLRNNKELYAHEEYRAISLAFLTEQNKLATEEIQAEAKLKFVQNNEGRLLDQAAHKLRIGHINAEHDAMQALIDAQAKKDDLKFNRDKYLEEELQKLKTGHANKANELTLAAIANEAKAQDLVNNKADYIREATEARENAFYEEQNRLAEDRISTETEIAWERANIDKVMAQDLQKKRLSHLKEYQEYQKKAGRYAISQEKFEKNQRLKENKAARKEASSEIFDNFSKLKTGEFSITDLKESTSKYIGQRTAELKDSGMSDASAKLTAQFELLAEVSGNLAQQLSQTADKIGEKQATIDTRLQGSTVNDTKFGSYWRQLAKDMNSIGAVNPYFKQEDFASNIETLVNKGISFDIKQRAFLMTIQEKIANTFDVADGTLLRLIRIQQQDTTAGRLGMESALNSFLNSMYETSEYLTNVASSVRSSLEEMQALMEGAAGTELEFQVQKWMGSLYSVGMSDSAVQGIAQAFGQIASGDVGGLTGSGTGNLIIMAANEAGKSIADILQEGLDAKETNELMQAMVNYLAEIAETSSDSRVVQQQLANVYGLKASDLRAATNLASSIKDVSNQDLTYSGMLGQLNKMANSMILRTSTGEMLSNVWGNVQYTMGTQMASNPILYLLPKVATLLEDFAGGIDLPFLNVMGFGVDLNTSVAQLMNVASMSGTILGALGPMISGLTAAVSGSAMLNLAGINASGKAPVIARGAPATLQNVSGSGLSESGYIGNSSGDDVKNATLQDAADSKKKQMVEAKEEETADDTAMKADLAVVNIYNLLEEVAHGSQSLRVRLVGGNGNGSAPVLSCSCNHNDPLTGEPATSVATPGAGRDGADNGNWVLAF